MKVNDNGILDKPAHDMPSDLAAALNTNTEAQIAWDKITPKARNEWICWTVSVKQEKTRIEHVKRAVNELAQGKRRPCCWIGCIHRTDKAVSPWVQKVIIDKQPKV